MVEYGALSVMMAGEMLMPLLCVDSLATQQLVSYIHVCVSD